MKKKTWIMVSVIGVLLFSIGISYALWLSVFTQTGENILSTDCFEVTFLEDANSNISLQLAYPITEAEGSKLKPYTFTIKNICSSTASYQVNMETHSNSTMPNQIMRVKLNEESTLLTNEVEPTVGERAYKIGEGTLYPNETKSFEVRVWMDERTTMEDGASGKSFIGKVTVVASYSKEHQPLIAMLQNMDVVEEGSGLYEVSHKDASITYTTDEEAISNLKQTERRYAGFNPANYVWFNDELWRMIGLVNTPEGQRIKIIRDESIGAYSWDSSDSTVNSGYGVNEWSQADLMKLLNPGYENESVGGSLYYHRGSGICYNADNNATTKCDFSSIGLTNEAKNMIDTITWNTGSNDGEIYTQNNITADIFYNLERSNSIGKICSNKEYCTDNEVRTIEWKGKIGLMYPSDYGYATSGSSIIDRTSCLAATLYSWDNYNDCYLNNWIFDDSMAQWFLTPNAHLNFSRNVFKSGTDGNVFYGTARSVGDIFPAIYLTTNIKVSDGVGTQENPYRLSLD